MGQVNWTKQLILAVTLLVVSTLAYWLEYKHKPEAETAEESSKKIFALKDSQIESISVSDGKTQFSWECLDLQAKTCKPGDNSKWKMNEPMQTRADDSNINSLVSSLNNLTPMDTIDLKDESPEKRAALLKEYGLGPDVLGTDRKIAVKTSGGGTTIAYFGGSNPINDGIFAVIEKLSAGQKPTMKPDASKVYLIPSYFKSNFDHNLSYWRDKKVLSLAASEVDGFEIQSKKNGKLSAEKKNGQWVLRSQGVDVAADTENMEAFLNAAAYLMAKDFASDQKTDAKAKSALKGASVVETIIFKKAKGTAKEEPAPVTLTIYSKRQSEKKKPAPSRPGHPAVAASSEAVFATVSQNDPLYELQSTALTQLDKSLKDLRLTKLISSMERFSAKRIEFSGTPMGALPLVLVSRDGKWFNETDKSEANYEKVQSTLDHLSGNKIHEFLTGSSIPSGEKDGLKVTIGDDKDPAKRQLLFWKKDGKLLARDLKASRPEAFLVDGMVADGLPWDRAYYSTPKAGAPK